MKGWGALSRAEAARLTAVQALNMALTELTRLEGSLANLHMGRGLRAQEHRDGTLNLRHVDISLGN